jgi:hypothetical protein
MRKTFVVDIPDSTDPVEADRLLDDAVWEMERKLQAQLLAPNLSIVLRRPMRMDVSDVLLWAFQHFYNMDKANAAMHCAPVRYSPITFRFAQAIEELRYERGEEPPTSLSVLPEVWSVLHDIGSYAEDPGR